MKNKKTIIVLLIISILCAQITIFNAETSSNIKEQVITFTNNTFQPYGLYFSYADCSITAYKGYVQVTGITEATVNAGQLSVKLSLLKENNQGNWVSIWNDSITKYNSFEAYFPKQTVITESGYNYKLQGTHTIKHNGKTETAYSESDSVFVN